MCVRITRASSMVLYLNKEKACCHGYTQDILVFSHPACRCVVGSSATGQVNCLE